MKKSTRLFITGSVQGIFFEQFIKENADKRSIKGFLRKLDDGRKEIFIEGEASKVDEMAEICKRGPKYARIRKVEEIQAKMQDFKEFKILRI